MDERSTMKHTKNIAITRSSNNENLKKQVKSAINGGRDELACLCETIARDVLIHVLHWIPNSADAESVAQNILICVCGRTQWLTNPEAFGGWLKIIMNNEIYRHSMKGMHREKIVGTVDFNGDAVTGGSIGEVEKSQPYEYGFRKNVFLSHRLGTYTTVRHLVYSPVND